MTEQTTRWTRRIATMTLAALLAWPLAGCVVYDKNGEIDHEASRQVNQSIMEGFGAAAQAAAAGVEAWAEYERARTRPQPHYCTGSPYSYCAACHR